jgi:putative ABC transport system ATP-binding protein
MIEGRGLSLVYHDHGKEVFACKDVDLQVKPGEFLGILGPSGSGKSSLLYLLSGLKTPSSGEVLFADKPLNRLTEKERARLRVEEFGFVFQHAFLIGYLTARENVLVATPGRDCSDHADELLEQLGLKNKAHRMPHELSGGERQRVSVARALVGGRKAIFADEPTAALDHHTGEQVVELLQHNRGEGSLVMVTHDPSMLTHADRVITISDGKVEEMRYS